MTITENGQEAKGQVLTLDDDQLRTHAVEMARQNVGETMSQLLHAEADECVSTRAGYLKMPRELKMAVEIKHYEK